VVGERSSAFITRSHVVSNEPGKSTPAPKEIREQLSRIVASADFSASAQLTRFLRFIVDTSLAGHDEKIKERTVAIHALDRDANFDPRLDPIVRMVAGKLRRALERFYAGEGAHNPVRIQIPKGSYRPVFTRNFASDESTFAIKAPSESPCKRPVMAALPVVAVIPFVAFTRGKEERQLGDSIAQDICVGLSKFTWFETIDYVVARARCHHRFDPIDVASRLHADFCLTGTVRRQGDVFRTSVELTDACVGAIIWADEFDMCTGHEDVGSLDQATQRIVATIGGMFGALAAAVWSRARQKPLHQLSACEAVLCNLRYQSELADCMYADAVLAAKHAIKLAPDFAWGWAAMANLHLDGFALVAKDGAENASEQALWCIQRALKADPTSAYAHWTLGLYHLMHGQADEAVRAAELTVECAQGSPFETGAAGAIMSVAGDHERGQSFIDQALQINPQLPGWIHWGTVINDLQRTEFEKSLASSQRFSLPECFWDHILHAASLSGAGDFQQALVEVQRASQLRPELGQRTRELVARIVQEPDLQEMIVDTIESEM
jgi:adenylate cyclase